jgi:signal transduction histidine kinase
MRNVRSPTVVRLGATFAAVLLLFATALAVVLHGNEQLANAEREVTDVDHARYAGYRVAVLVREQYIHQAHTVIEWNESHIGHYRAIAARTRDATRVLATFARSSEEAGLAREIADLVRKNDEDFLRITVPAIRRDEHEEVTRLHAATEQVVTKVSARVEQLDARFELRSTAARSRAERLRSRMRSITLGCFGLATLLAGLAGVMTTRRIGVRLAALRRGVERLGEGDLTRRIALAGDDELSDLARRFDEMAAKLEDHQRQTLRQQKLASMGRLCAGVAHEINGPLGIILGFAKVARRDGIDDEALAAIEDEARRCQHIVEGLLDMSRQDIARFQPVDLGALAREAVDRLRAAGKLGGRRVDVFVHGESFASGDDAKLRQVISNLLTNAVEATSNVGSISVEVDDDPRGVLVAVTDDGPGMSLDARERLFEPFFTTKDHGTGLGLAITRAIVEALRGEVNIFTSPGGGTRVEIVLDAAAPPPGSHP